MQYMKYANSVWISGEVQTMHRIDWRKLILLWTGLRHCRRNGGWAVE